MSEVNLNFALTPVEANLTVTTNDISFTPTPINMTFYTGSAPIPPAGPAGNTQIQYNNNGLFAGSNSFVFNNTSNTVTIANANVNILSANNFASTGGNISLGSVTNLHITGGTNGYVLQTDGTGNLGWTAMGGGGGGNGTPGGSNTQVQFNDAGTFGGVAGFTYNNSTQTLTAPKYYGNGAALYNLSGGTVVGAVYEAFHANAADVANSVAGANVTGSVNSATTAANVVNPAQGNITSVGTLTSLGVSGNVTVGGYCVLNQLTANNANLGASVNAGYFIGDGSLLTNLSIAGGSFIANGNSNISIASSGADATVSINGTSNVIVISTSNTSFTSNIGTTKNITATGNITGAIITGSSLVGSGSGITNINGANITGTVANANFAISASYANVSDVSTTATYIAPGTASAYQPNIKRIGTTQFATYLSPTISYSGTTYTFNVTLGQIQTCQTIPGVNLALDITSFAASVGASTAWNGTFILNNGFGNAYTINDIKVDGISQLTNIKWGNYTGNATSGPQNLVPPAGCSTQYNILITKSSGNTLTTYVDAKYYKIYST